MNPNARKMLAVLFKLSGGRTDVLLARGLELLDELEKVGIDIDEEGRLWGPLLDAGWVRKVALGAYYLTPVGVATAQGEP
jgi:hypothetical protein